MKKRASSITKKVNLGESKPLHHVPHPSNTHFVYQEMVSCVSGGGQVLVGKAIGEIVVIIGGGNQRHFGEVTA